MFRVVQSIGGFILILMSSRLPRFRCEEVYHCYKLANLSLTACVECDSGCDTVPLGLLSSRRDSPIYAPPFWAQAERKRIYLTLHDF